MLDIIKKLTNESGHSYALGGSSLLVIVLVILLLVILL